jgi:predicted nucleic acid-binding protein
VGILLDSTVVIRAERSGKNPRNIIDELAVAFSDTDAALSVVTVVELAHGIERADSEQRRDKRERFVSELLREIPVQPVTVPIALRAGRIGGVLQAQGAGIALGDLLIGATALELGYAVVTHNVRHFERIPDLSIKRL